MQPIRTLRGPFPRPLLHLCGLALCLAASPVRALPESKDAILGQYPGGKPIRVAHIVPGAAMDTGGDGPGETKATAMDTGTDGQSPWHWTVRQGPGQVDAKGLYTAAPGLGDRPEEVILRATSVDNPNHWGEATLVVTPWLPAGVASLVKGYLPEAGEWSEDCPFMNLETKTRPDPTAIVETCPPPAAGQVRLVAGGPGEPGTRDGALVDARFSNLKGLAASVCAEGNPFL